MVHDSAVMHHIHKRKRIHQKYEVYPHPNKWKRLFDDAIYIGGFAGLAFTIPQILKIWVGQNAAGVSVISWAAYMVGSLLWITYGIMHKEKPILVVYSGWFIAHLLVMTGAIIYG